MAQTEQLIWSQKRGRSDESHQNLAPEPAAAANPEDGTVGKILINSTDNIVLQIENTTHRKQALPSSTTANVESGSLNVEV